MRLPLLVTLGLALPSPLVSAQEIKLLASDGAPYDYFGYSVAISGNTAVVGATEDDDNGLESGSAYLFDTTTGAQTSKLLPSDGTHDEWFGCSVAISGNTAIIGAKYDSDNGPSSGSAYLFDTTTGAQLAKLLPSDGQSSDEFGYTVAISGNIAIVGAFKDDDNGTAAGSAYLFDTTTGAQIAKLFPSDAAAFDYFGNRVAISGNTAIVGAKGDDDNGSNSGSAYLFDTTTGAQIAKLLPSDGASGVYFGYSVAISGTTAIVSSPWDNDVGLFDSGSAYLFDTTTGAQIAKLLPSDGASIDNFGASVAISGETAIVGAWLDDDNGENSGSAYLFDATTGAQLAKLLPSDGTLYGFFGHSIALSGTTALVGALSDNENGYSSGSAYLFGATTPPGDSFCHGDGSGAPCPCGNSGAPGEGCANDTGSGARLTASGSNSVLADDLTLEATGLTPGPGLYFQGNNAINSGNGDPFGDGLRCAGSQVVRLEVRFSTGGSSATTISIATKGGASVGDTKRYQLWYRDTGSSPCNNLFNLTNGYEITWTP